MKQDRVARFVIAGSEATKQSILACGSMDCFASLAMTVIVRDLFSNAAMRATSDLTSPGEMIWPRQSEF
jgi:hypothetical protein